MSPYARNSPVKPPSLSRLDWWLENDQDNRDLFDGNPKLQ